MSKVKEITKLLTKHRRQISISNELKNISDDPPFGGTLVSSPGASLCVYVGSVSDSMYVPALKRLNIIGIKNAAADQCRFIQKLECTRDSEWTRVEFTREWYSENLDVSFSYLPINAEDISKYVISDHFDECHDWANSIVHKDDTPPAILIHCIQGKNRSVALAAALLVMIEKISLLEAIERIASRRENVLSNKFFIKQLVEYFSVEAELNDPSLCAAPCEKELFEIGPIVERF